MIIVVTGDMGYLIGSSEINIDGNIDEYIYKISWNGN